MLELNHQIPINASAAKVYRAVSTEEGMRGWWTADTEMEERSGGKADFGFDNRAMNFRMTIDALDANKRVRMTCSGEHPEWAGTQLEWEITDQNGKSILSFTHRDWRQMTSFCASCNSTWGELMYRLKNFVETGRPDPHWKL